MQNPYAEAPYNPYSPQQPNNAPIYTPTPNNVPVYGSPPPSNNASYGAGIPAFPGPVPVRPKPKVGLVTGIIIAVLVIGLVIGAIAMAGSKHGTTTGSTGDTVGTKPIATPTPIVPSGNSIDPTAASIVTDIQMASAIDADTYEPTKLTTSFKTYTDIYSTFQINFANANVSLQNPGYVEAKYYMQKTPILTVDPLTVDDSTGGSTGYFKVEYYRATTAATVEFYWCRQSNCSDAKLAGTSSFTVS
jgi:hypothetical protein